MSCNTCGNPMTSHFHTKGYCSEVCLRDGHIEALEAELERERDSNLTALADADKLYEERWKVVEMLAGELAGMKNQYHNEETTGSRETQMAEAWAETQVKEGKK